MSIKVDFLTYRSSTASIAFSVVPVGSGLHAMSIFSCRCGLGPYPTMKWTLPGGEFRFAFDEVKNFAICS